MPGHWLQYKCGGILVTVSQSVRLGPKGYGQQSLCIKFYNNNKNLTLSLRFSKCTSLCLKGRVYYFTMSILKEQAVYGHQNGAIHYLWT